MPQLIWLDIETTGLNPSKNSILEVAAAVANFNDPFTIGEFTQGVVWYHPHLIKNLEPFIVDMHTKNGLLKECGDETKAIDTFELEDVLLKLVPDVTDKDEKPILAGSSVHFDHSFIETWMPKLAKRLSHRHYDVSALKLFCQSMGMSKFPKGEAHRAKDDVLESIVHAKKCVQWVKENLR